MPTATNEFVAWVDVMGTKSSMSRSIAETANFIFKLHIAAIGAAAAGLRLYPVMDGVYATAADQATMLTFLRRLFHALAVEFNQTTEPFHRFIVRGGLAFGPVIHGSGVQPAASGVLAAAARHRDAILLGMPMVQAHTSEADAPPFGVYVHESARVFPPVRSRLRSPWWVWRDTATAPDWTALMANLPAHFQWCQERALPLLYPVDRIKVHLEMVEQYSRLN
jgi:hypothetical protein